MAASQLAFTVFLKMRIFLNYTDEMLECVGKGLEFTWRTCESTLERTHCTSAHQSCIIGLSRVQAGHRDLDHIIMNILTAAPLRRSKLETTGSEECPNKLLRYC